MQCISVDLPDPDGPITAVNRPRSKVTLTPDNALTAAIALPVGLPEIDGMRRGPGGASSTGVVTDRALRRFPTAYEPCVLTGSASDHPEGGCPGPHLGSHCNRIYRHLSSGFRRLAQPVATRGQVQGARHGLGFTVGPDLLRRVPA